MLSVGLVCVGSLKEEYWRSACAEYEKRLSRWCRFTLAELPEARLPKDPGEKEITAALASEAAVILGRTAKTTRIALCVEGKQLSSEAFAQKLSSIATRGSGAVSLIVGSSFGLADAVKEAADFCFSMSELTFPHQLARVMLMEQLYRAFSILNGSKYHK